MTFFQYCKAERWKQAKVTLQLSGWARGTVGRRGGLLGTGMGELQPLTPFHHPSPPQVGSSPGVPDGVPLGRGLQLGS